MGLAGPSLPLTTLRDLDRDGTTDAQQGGYWHFPAGARIEMRLVHIFEMRDGKIAKEIVFDMGQPIT
jgi:ketosteroid isomerase-like protein